MSVVKLFVLLYCICAIWCSRNKYCDLCINHTLCVYTVPGASNQCDGYEASPITNRDKIEIVNRINERRNFVAMGKLHPFPQAANMNKIMWSTELANIAQRWVDQCDPFVKPDREDHCRNLAEVPVGQNIATVIGVSPGLNVKSMIDIWFMQNIFFTGTVTYYNQSSTSKSNYFTQLIWAETEFVGCGKAKFYVEQVRSVVMRIVCNFAPKGNREGKPIYVIGLPNTQCSYDTIPNSRYPGLCQRQRRPGTMFAVETSTVKSLLRILNLSNDSLKQELDPNNFKTINLSNSVNNYLRNQKTRHIYLNNRYGAIKRDSFHVDPPIQSDNYKDHQHTSERGHSRMYHGHQTRKESVYSYEPIKTYSEQNSRRNDFTTASLPYSEQNYRRHYMNRPVECTRAIHVNENGCCSTGNQYVTNECTRGNNCQQHNCQKQQNPCQSIPCPPKPCQQIHQSHQNSLCSCNEQLGCSTPVSQCGQSPKCPYASSTCATNPTPLCGFRRSEEADVTKSTPPNYYDLFPNLEIKSGDRKSSPENQQHHRELNNDYPMLRRRKDNDNDKQVTFCEMSKNKGLPNIQDSYHNFDSSAREKRDSEEKTFKPFWQVDDFIHKKPSDLKSIRYTTLSNRKRKKGYYKQTAFMTNTEPITITFKGNHRPTEKYLSFDELMHLRKFNDETEEFYDTRRNAKEGNEKAKASPPAKPQNTNNPSATKLTTKTTTTTKPITKAITKTAALESIKITEEPAFKRVKHCTRKLTCTWTAKFSTASGAGPIGPNIEDFGGSRTPPGYVDGCTRTSTCTRDYMERNKYDTCAPEDEEEAAETTTGTGYNADEDYCERRDLNKRRRDLVDVATNLTIYVQEFRTTPFTKAFTLVITSESPITRSQIESSVTEINSSCNKDSVRYKRNNRNYEKFIEKSCFGKTTKLITRTQRSYQSTSNTIRSQKRKISSKCPCNNGKSLQNTFCFVIFIQFILF